MIDEPFESNSNLKAYLDFNDYNFICFKESKFLNPIADFCINFKFSKKSKLAEFKRLIPENVLLGRNDSIGGIFPDDNIRK